MQDHLITKIAYFIRHKNLSCEGSKNEYAEKNEINQSE